MPPDTTATRSDRISSTASQSRTPSQQELIAEFDSELPSRRLPHGLDAGVTAYCFAVSVFVLWQVFFPLRQGNQYSLILFLGATLPLAFLTYRARSRREGVEGNDSPGWTDWTAAAVAALVCFYPVLPVAIGTGGGGFNEFLNRQGTLVTVDVVMGAVLAVLILEGCRRTTGVVLPIICLAFFAYAYYGGFLPPAWPIGHAGFDFGQINNGLYKDPTGF